MKISIIHPTRQRASIAYSTFRNWTEKASDWNNFEYVMAVDTDDRPGQYQEFRKNFALNFYIAMGNNKTAIEAINRAAEACTGDLIVVISDDFDCPEHWDTLLLEALAGKEDFLVKTQDGLQKTLITLPIMDRKYYERFGYIYHPDYKHMHCDEEMTIVGHMLGKVITLPLLFPHNHYTTGKFKKDAISERNDATWAHGQHTLNRRAKGNFGIANPLVRREDIKWK